jgi:translation initiation factor 4G
VAQTSSQDGSHSNRTRDKRNGGRNGPNKIRVFENKTVDPVATHDAPAYKRATKAPVDEVEKKVRALMNKLTLEKFEPISNQIIALINKSERERDGRTLLLITRFVFENATNEVTWSGVYALLCRKIMEEISPNVQDDGIRDANGKRIGALRAWLCRGDTLGH